MWLLQKGISMTVAKAHRMKRKQSFVVALILGLSATLVAAIGLSPAFSGFTASINNTQNTVGTGTLLMSQLNYYETCFSSSPGTVTVANEGSCGDFAKGRAGVPGTEYEASIAIKNDGNVPARTFTLVTGVCSSYADTNQPAAGSGTSDFCGKVNIAVQDDSDNTAVCMVPASAERCGVPTQAYTMASLANQPIALKAPVLPGETRYITFHILVDNSVTNSHQGLIASMSAKWTFST